MKTNPITTEDQIANFGQPFDANDPNSRVIGDLFLMEMATITYCSISNNVQSTLSKYYPKWKVIWQPVKAEEGIWAFVATRFNTFVLAIRGSLLTLSWGAYDNWLHEDLNVFEQVKWEYSTKPDSNPMIAKGTDIEIKSLLKLVDEKGQGLFDVLEEYVFKPQLDLFITGHSLGGNLSTVYASYLRYQMIQKGFQRNSTLRIMTFASPSSWNKDFADEYDASFPNSWRYHNTLDMVPLYVENIASIGNLYPPPAPNAANIKVSIKIPFTKKEITVSLKEALKIVAEAVKIKEIEYNSFYTSVNQSRGSVAINTEKLVFPVDQCKPEIEQWASEVADQHASKHYLFFLGGHPIICGS